MSRFNQTIDICEESNSIHASESVYLWNGYISKKNYSALLGLLEINSDFYRCKLQSILSTILQRTYGSLISHNQKTPALVVSFFANSFFELGTLKTEAWINTLRLLVLENELNFSQVKKIIYRGTNRQVHQCLQKLSKKRELEYELRKRKAIGMGRCSHRIWKSLPPLLRAPLYLCRYLFKRWPLRLIAEPKWFAEENSLFFFSYFIHLDPKSGASAQFYSKQWEQLPKKLQAQGYRLNWIHLFLTSPLVPDVNVGRKWIEAFENDSLQQGHHALLDQYLDWAISEGRQRLVSCCKFLHH